VLMVPYRMTVDVAGEAEPARHLNGLSSNVRSEQLLLQGRSDEFRIESGDRPLELTLDPRGEILARFYSAVDFPKRVLTYRAFELALEGRHEEAEAVYFQALEAKTGKPATDPPVPWMRDAERDADQQDAKIRLALARIYLDQARDGEALAQLDAVDGLLEQDSISFRMERDALRSRIDVLRGDYAAAFRRLKKTFRYAAPRRRVGWHEFVWKLRLGSERLAMTEAFALHAIAAFETGSDEELNWALQQARERGADVSVLEQAIERRARSEAVRPARDR
jgi:tetratricopeptide (TPR) repeat protein